MTKISNFRKAVRDVVDGFAPGESHLTLEICAMAEQVCESLDIARSARNDYTYSVLRLYEEAGKMTRTCEYTDKGKKVVRWTKL